MSEPFFSVIIPAYNSAGYIRKGLDSIARQTFRDFELIVVCDSCLDETEEIAREYGARVFRVDYGQDGMTRNKGLDEARGKWILFMDDDDWFLHEYVFQQLAEMAGQHGENAVAFSYIWKTLGYTWQDPQNVSVHVWSKLWRRDFIGDTRFSIRKYWSDSDFHNKMMRKPGKIVYWNMPMYYYNYCRKGSQTEQFYNGLTERQAAPAVIVCDTTGTRKEMEERAEE